MFHNNYFLGICFTCCIAHINFLIFIMLDTYYISKSIQDKMQESGIQNRFVVWPRTLYLNFKRFCNLRAKKNCSAVCLAVRCRIDNRAKKQFVCVATTSKAAVSFVIAVVRTDDLLRQILWCLLSP